MAVGNNGKNEIRELAVLLAIADASTGNGYYRLGEEADYGDIEYDFDVSYSSQPIIGSDGNEYNMKFIDYDTNPGWADNGMNEVNEPQTATSLSNGYEFCKALRSYDINIDQYGNLACETDWERGIPQLAKDNYALGMMIANYFGLGPGSVAKLVWYGPENLKGNARRKAPPADIGIKLIGTPSRQFAAEAVENYDVERTELDAWSDLITFYDNEDTDIKISLKDGSDILGTLGFAPFANMLLDAQYKRGTDCFALYAPAEYDAWFNTAWQMMINDIAINGPFETTSTRSGTNYYIYLEGDQVVFEKEGEAVLPVPVNMNRETWMSRQMNGNAKKAFSYWCVQVGRKQLEYINAQTLCSAIVSSRFSQELKDGIASERFYELVGWRMASYYYAKVSMGNGLNRSLVLCGVPSAYNAGEFPLEYQAIGDPVLSEESSEYDEPLTTQAISSFTLSNQELGINASFQLVMRFTDGMFKTVPQVNVKTIGEYPGTYYLLQEEPLTSYF